MKTSKKIEPETDLPLSEKDEVKKAERKTAELQNQVSETKKNSGKPIQKSNK